VGDGKISCEEPEDQPDQVMTDPCRDSCDTEGYQYCGESRFRNGTYACLCMKGFAQIREGSGCNDINECLSSDFNNCDVNGYCVNIPGSYFCECNPGFVGYGREGGCTATPAPSSFPSAHPTSAPSSSFVPSPAPTPRPTPRPTPPCLGNGSPCTNSGQCCSNSCGSPSR
jgi:hypothetical protein